MWHSLKSKLMDLRDEFVPLETVSEKPTWKEKGSVPIDKLTREAIHSKNKKHRLWMQAKGRNEADAARLQYTQARNKVKTLLRKAKRAFERDIDAIKSKP